MNKESVFNTLTIAKVYASQGYFKESLEILDYLKKKDPQKKEYEEEFKSVELNLNKKRDENIVSLFNEWTTKLVPDKKTRLQKLENIRNNLSV